MSKAIANKTIYNLPLSSSDAAYLLNLLSIDIVRLKGSEEARLRRIAYRLHDKTKRLFRS